MKHLSHSDISEEPFALKQKILQKFLRLLLISLVHLRQRFLRTIMLLNPFPEIAVQAFSILIVQI